MPPMVPYAQRWARRSLQVPFFEPLCFAMFAVFSRSLCVFAVWGPTELGGFEHAPEVNKGSYEKYTVKVNRSVSMYVLTQFIIVVLFSALMLFDSASEAPMIFKKDLQQWFAAFLFVFTLLNGGGMFELKSWVRIMEFCRLFSVLLLPVFFYGQAGFVGLFVITNIYAIASLIWLIPIQKYLVPASTIKPGYSIQADTIKNIPQ